MNTTFRTLASALVAGLALAGGAHAASGGGASKLQALDTNNDGMLSRSEAQAHPHLTQNFDAIDTNHDGQLSRDELQAWHATHKGGKEGKGGFSKLDTNADGQIERSEVQNNPRELAKFDAADTNHDGVVTKDEARAARAAHRADKATSTQ
jgi:Ca2+-binding EF-hand superfamily protein